MADDGTTTGRRCAHCSHPMPDVARFCANCGVPVRPNVAPATLTTIARVVDGATGAGPRKPAVGSQTVLGFGATSPFGGGAPPTLGGGAPPTLGGPSRPTAGEGAPVTLGGGAPPTLAGSGPSVAPRASPGRPPAALHRTMLGLAAAPVSVPVPLPVPLPAAGSTAILSPGPPNPGKPGPMPHQTMLGIAMPGIAPLQPNEPPGPLPGSTPAPTPRYPLMGSTAIAPVGPSSTLFPPPEPLSELPAPRPAHVVRPRGVPLATVAFVAGVLLLVGGFAIAWFWRSNFAVTAEPHASPSGEDILHLHCDPRSCHDGTTAEINGTKATFAGGECDLTLAEPLRVGENALAVRLDRPGMGRDEVLKLSVPVAFRVRADPSAMSAMPPAIVIRVEARPGSEVTVDGKPLALDANGAGAYAIDETVATDGPADESRVVSVDVPYVVVPAAGPGPAGAVKGTVSARVVVAPLRVDAPSAHAVVEGDHVVVAGRAAKGANVTVGGAPVAVGPEGAFEANVALPPLAGTGHDDAGVAGSQATIEVRADTASLRPRTVRLSVRRVASLADEARAFERHEKTVGYDAATRDLTAAVGRSIVVDGEIIDSRSFGYRSVLLVDDRRGCARGPCLARVILDQDLAPNPGAGGGATGASTLIRGTIVRACGRIARPFTTPSGQAVPEVEADFITRIKR